MIDVQSAAHALGGEVSGRNSIVCPGPGHSLADRSLSIKLIPTSAVGDGFVVHNAAIMFASDWDWLHGIGVRGGNTNPNRRLRLQ